MTRKKKRRATGNPNRLPPQVAKLCGGDYELGNFVYGLDRGTDTCYEASHALLKEIEGFPLVSKRHAYSCDCSTCRPAGQESSSELSDSVHGHHPSDGNNPYAYSSSSYGYSNGSRYGMGVVYDAQDVGRRFLASNGGCVYIDLNHLELCLPEVLTARDHVAASHAMLRIARKAWRDANSKLPQGQVLHAMVNNSDGLGHSFGSHLNFLITRRAWSNLFDKKLHLLLFLASYQVSSIIFTGQGKVGSENGRPPVPFQLSQRADFMETMMGDPTTFNRPIVNRRNEALCGRSYGASAAESVEADLARLHVIFYDNNLCQIAAFLKVGVLQIILAMIEAEQCDPALTLDDPLEALVRWSHDPTLMSRALLTSGQEVTAIQLQLRFLASARRFVERGGAAETVPDAAAILNTWEETLGLLEQRNLPALARRLDWALKLFLIRRVLDQRTQLDWNSAEVKHLDQIYGSLDPQTGLYWACEKSGLVERVVDERRIQFLTEHPPENTRAWTRTMLLRRAKADEVDDVDWDFLRFRLTGPGRWAEYRSIDLPSPLDFTREATESIFERYESLEEVLNALTILAEAPETATRTVQ